MGGVTAGDQVTGNGLYPLLVSVYSGYSGLGYNKSSRIHSLHTHTHDSHLSYNIEIYWYINEE